MYVLTSMCWWTWTSNVQRSHPSKRSIYNSFDWTKNSLLFVDGNSSLNVIFILFFACTTRCGTLQHQFPDCKAEIIYLQPLSWNCALNLNLCWFVLFFKCKCAGDRQCHFVNRSAVNRLATIILYVRNMRVCPHSHQLPIIEWRQSCCLFIFVFFFSRYFRIFWCSSVFLLHYSHCLSSNFNLEVIDNVNNDKKKS